MSTVVNAADFTSALAPQLETYLAFKEKMGFYGASRIWYLKQFDAYCTAHARTVFDRDTVEGWVSERPTRSGAVPVLDVLHPRRRPVLAGPRPT